MSDSEAEARAAALPPEFRDVMRLTKISGMLGRPFFQRFAKQYSLTLNEWRVVVALASTPGIAGQDISDRVGLHPMNVSRAVATLRTDGRVRVHQDPENHRRQLVALTEQGWELFRTLYPSAEAQALSLFSVLDEQEKEVLSGVLERLLDRLEVLLDGSDGETAEPDH